MNGLHEHLETALARVRLQRSARPGQRSCNRRRLRRNGQTAHFRKKRCLPNAAKRLCYRSTNSTGTPARTVLCISATASVSRSNCATAERDADEETLAR